MASFGLRKAIARWGMIVWAIVWVEGLGAIVWVVEQSRQLNYPE